MYDSIDGRDIFICHSSEDMKVASSIVSRLEARGVSCWIAPRDVKPGASYADSLYYAIEKAPVFVVLMSAAANKSNHVVRELEIADQIEKRVVPVRLEDFEATGAFCYYTRAAHFYRWNDEPTVVLSRILEQVRESRSSGQAGEEPADEEAINRDKAGHKPKRKWWRFW